MITAIAILDVVLGQMSGAMLRGRTTRGTIKRWSAALWLAADALEKVARGRNL